MAAEPATRPQRRRFLNVSNRLAALGAIGVSIAFLLVVLLQTDRARSLLYQSDLDHSIYTTQLIARELHGAVRWRKPEVIQRTYNSIKGHDQLGIAGAATIDNEGELLAAYQRRPNQSPGLYQVLIEAARAATGTGTGTILTDRWFVVTSPVAGPQGQNRVGTLALAWSLDPLNQMAASLMIQAATVASLTIAAFITATLLMVDRYLSKPLTQIAEATRRISNGDKKCDIPCIERKDEIGDMAHALVTFQENVALIDRLTADQQKQNQRLAAALEKEREYNALHREFVAMVSHEFRTPIAIVDGAAQRIERRAGRDDTDQLRERTGKIRAATARMIELIDSTLSLYRIEEGSVKLEFAPCDFAGLLDDICKRHQDITKTHEITLTVENLPPTVMIDAHRIDQVFTNLLSNAVKYSPGARKISVSAAGRGETVVVSVRDHGLGIPRDEQSKLFQKFFRASTATGIPGTGIGLHLCNTLVQMHNGHITVVSKPGEGSTFSVTLPVVQPGTAASDPDATPREAAMRLA